MADCQKVSMSKGVAYPRTCPVCGLGPCAKGYPGWFVPKRGEAMPDDPYSLPRERPAKAPDANG